MRLFVGNLPFKATEQDIQGMFEDAGITVSEISVMRDKFSGQSRGFGFVEVDASLGERAVAACNGKQLMGRQLVVNEARPPQPNGNRERAPRRDRY